MAQKTSSNTSPRKGFWANNGLTIVLFSLFVVFLAGQAGAGWIVSNQTHTAHGLQSISLGSYVTSGTFLEPIFQNWQAAVLQLAALIFFGIFLRQRGAAHSQDPDAPKKKPREPDSSGRPAPWIYRHSLVLALACLFAVFFTCHLFAGAAANRTQRILNHRRPLSVGAFAVSPEFWFTNFQTWQAEFFAIAVYVTFTIFLREEGSPESKPVSATNSDTDKTDG